MKFIPLTGELIDPEYPDDGGLNIFSGKLIDLQCEANAEWVQGLYEFM